MLSSQQLSVVRELLESSQNPLFFFDNDPDGLCSFLLLRRFIDRGKGVPIKSFPSLDASYLRKLDELNPDVVFVLDKPLISKEFLDGARDRNVKVVILDHHDVPNPSIGNPEINYFNPLTTVDSSNGGVRSNEPTTFLAYSVAHKSGDEWLALIGCISDNFIPPFSVAVFERFPELWKPVSSAFTGVYETPLGRAVKVLGFSLMDSISGVVNMIRFLNTASSPHELFDESNINRYFHRYKVINPKYQGLIDKALNTLPDTYFPEIVYFQYGGSLSISSYLANELFYNNLSRTVIVAYLTGAKANISIRSKSIILPAAEYAISTIPGATGGGHNNAVGASIPAEDVLNFKKRFAEALRREN